MTEVRFAEALGLWTRIGLLSFGGPAGQIALMHRLLVEERRWISEGRFLHALNYCMLLPGPEAMQLATYIGWLLHGTKGGLVAGALFVLPGFVVILGLSALYAGLRDVALVAALFYGIKPAVLAVVIEAVLRIARRALKGPLSFGLAAAAFVALFFLALPFPLVIAAAAAIGALAGGSAKAKQQPSGPDLDPARPADRAALAVRPSAAASFKIALIWLGLWAAPVAVIAWLAPGSIYLSQALFFSKMAVVTFGGAYAVLSYVAQQAVEFYGWLTPAQMIDGLGLAETTPGPLILVLAFVAFLGAYQQSGALDPFLAGTLGAAITVWVTFVPCFLWIFLGAPYVEALRGNRRAAAALSGITAAVVGVVLNLALWFALHVAFGRIGEWRGFGLRLYVPEAASIDVFAVVLAALALVAMLRFHVGMITTLAAAAALGAVYSLLSTTF